MAPFIGSATNLIEWTLPLISLEIKPALSRTLRCLEIAGSEISKGFAISSTDFSPAVSFSTIALRVGSASADSVESIVPEVYLTIWLNISRKRSVVKGYVLHPYNRLDSVTYIPFITSIIRDN